MSFLPEIIGRETLKQQLLRIQKDERIKVILFYGAPGIGKHFVANAFARSLLCVADVSRCLQGACGQCSSCQLWQNGGHPDFTNLQAEPKEKVLKTDRLREEVLADIHYTPRLARKRVFVIDTDVLNEVGQNVLLKTLEEIPAYAYILLTVTNPEQLLVTVRSRCLPLHVEPLSANDLAKVLGQHLGQEWQNELTLDQLSWLQSVSSGSPGMALQYLSNGAFEASEAFVQLLEPALMGNNVLDPVSYLSQVMQNKDWFDLYVSLLLQAFTIISRGQIRQDKPQNFDSKPGATTPFWNQLLAIGNRVVQQKKLAPESVLNIIQYIIEAKEALSLNVNFDLAVNRLLLKIGKEMTHA